jgi:hypothetical protein
VMVRQNLTRACVLGPFQSVIAEFDAGSAPETDVLPAAYERPYREVRSSVRSSLFFEP